MAKTDAEKAAEKAAAEKAAEDAAAAEAAARNAGDAEMRALAARLEKAEADRDAALLGRARVETVAAQFLPKGVELADESALVVGLEVKDGAVSGDAKYRPPAGAGQVTTPAAPPSDGGAGGGGTFNYETASPTEIRAHVEKTYSEESVAGW